MFRFFLLFHTHAHYFPFLTVRVSASASPRSPVLQPASPGLHFVYTLRQSASPGLHFIHTRNGTSNADERCNSCPCQSWSLSFKPGSYFSIHFILSDKTLMNEPILYTINLQLLVVISRRFYWKLFPLSKFQSTLLFTILCVGLLRKFSIYSRGHR